MVLALIFSKELRNSVGIEFSPYSGDLWAVNNGRDMLGDDHPKEELNIIQHGKHYGWPYCYESKFLTVLRLKPLPTHLQHI